MWLERSFLEHKQQRNEKRTPCRVPKPGLAYRAVYYSGGLLDRVLSRFHGWGKIDPRLGREAALTLEAKLDTGADTSSLDAKVLKRFRRDGKHWLRFSVLDPATKERVILERPYLRGVRIKRHDGKHQRREVADLAICLGDRLHTIEVTLINREQFEYPLLLGRSALKGVALVDPGLKLTQNPRCAQAQSDQKTQVDRIALEQAHSAYARVRKEH